MMKNEVELIKNELHNIKTLFQKVVRIIPSFHLTDPKICPTDSSRILAR